MLDMNGLTGAIAQRVEPLLTEESRGMMASAHREGDPDFLIYMGLQYALVDDVMIPMDILDALAQKLDEPSFTPGMIPESRKWLAENRARTERLGA